MEFLHEVKKIPWSSLKFLDESSFNSRDIHRSHSYAPKGKPAYCIDSEPLRSVDAENYTVLMMVSLADKDAPLVLHMREKTNDQWDFLEFLIYLVEHGHLSKGDTLVLDNCAIHAATESSESVFSLLDAADVKLVFLPTYSPELNPCELVFADVKKHLCYNRTGDKFDREILFAFSTISALDLYLMYYECVWRDFLDPPVF